MKSLLVIPLVLISLMSFPSLGADFEKGFAAAQTGDFATALREWTPLAEQGGASAQFNLGLMYRNGWGVLQDDNAAVKWYTLAAQQGDAEAQFNLAILYAKGDGVIKDDVYAHMWANIASSNGNEGGGKVRELFAEIMTPSQLEKAQDLARECVAKKYKGC
jgi:TPR repeat protein